MYAFAGLFLLFFIFVVGHVRTAFKMKYSLPSVLPRGSELWDCVIDAIVSFIFLPCALAQMARHVFQYDRWNPPLTFFYKDPYALPALEECRQRPLIADEAGILWTDDRSHPDAEVHTGAADREREIRRQASYHNNTVTAPPIAHATATTVDTDSTSQSLVYRADGTIAR